MSYRAGIIVRNRQTILDTDLKLPHSIIQITTDPDDWPVLPSNPQRVGVLRLRYHDIDPPGPLPEAELEARRMFTRAMADQILEFIVGFPSDLLVCQCDAGISRSSATAAALGKICFDDDTFVFDNPRYRPNRHVYRTILGQYFGPLTEQHGSVE